MSVLDENDVVDDHDLDHGLDNEVAAELGFEAVEPPAPEASEFAHLAREMDHLRTCLEQLIDVVGNHQDQSEDLVLLAERMAFFERRILRVEDGVADLSWVVTRRVGDH